MWYLVYFLLVGTDPVAFQHPMDFHTDTECVAYLKENKQELMHPEITWAHALCVYDEKEIRH